MHPTGVHHALLLMKRFFFKIQNLKIIIQLILLIVEAAKHVVVHDIDK